MKTIWIEFAATDIDRAVAFYAEVFGHEPPEIERDDVRAIAIIPGDPIVSLTQTTGFEPGGHGTLAYFDSQHPLTTLLERVKNAGGGLVEEMSERPGYGFFAIVADTEGNHFYLHSGAR